MSIILRLLTFVAVFAATLGSLVGMWMAGGWVFGVTHSALAGGAAVVFLCVGSSYAQRWFFGRLCGAKADLLP